MAQLNYYCIISCMAEYSLLKPVRVTRDLFKIQANHFQVFSQKSSIILPHPINYYDSSVAKANILFTY
jgi:hypothetical protein